MASRARLHAELIAFLRQHCPARDQRHLSMLGWMVTGLLLSETVCFDHWKTRLPLGHCLAAVACQADLTLFNLETAVTSRDCWIPKTYNFRMHPAGLDVLTSAGIQCVSLANNHVLDFGLPGLLDTLQAGCPTHLSREIHVTASCGV